MIDDIQEITEVLKHYEKYVNESNSAGLGSLYCKDAILLPDRFDVFEGAEAIERFYAYAFTLLTLNLEFSIHSENIFVSGDVGYATTDSTGTRYLKEPDQTVPEINRELWVFNKVDGDWKIARYCFNKSE